MPAVSCLFYLLFVASLLAGVPDVASGQTTGTSDGKVTDPNGAVLSGATVRIAGPGGARVAFTDSEGRYQFRDLPAGAYSLTVTVEGFTPFAGSVIVTAGQNSSREIALRPAPLDHDIFVTVDVGVGVIHTDKLDIDKDIATVFDRLNGAQVNVREIINTDAARRDLTIRERVKESEYSATLSRASRNRLWFRGQGGVGLGHQELEYTSPTGRTVIGGLVWSPRFRGTAAWVFGSQAPVRPSLPRSRTEVFVQTRWDRVNGATREPAFSGSGRATADLTDIRTRRLELGARFVYERAPVSLWTGVEHFSYSYTLKRSLDIDFASTNPGVSLHSEGTTELSKRGVRLDIGATYEVRRRFALTFDSAVGPEAKRLFVGARIGIR